LHNKKLKIMFDSVRPALFLVSWVLIAFSCSSDEDGTEHSAAANLADCETMTEENADDCIHLNQIQVFGTHNSYKLYPHPDLVERINEVSPGWSENISYEHRPLREQLEELRMRQIELDIFADPEGGRYAEPVGALLINDEEFLRRDEMMEPGFKVLHTQDVDYRTSCLTLISCLEEIRDWSEKNPSHLPVMILIEVKQRAIESRHSLEFTEPLMFDEGLMQNIDDEIWQVFSRDHVITPDDVRGEYATLEEAVLVQGWPTLRESRGKVFFALDNTDETIDRYLSGTPLLENRVMFVSSPPGEPTAGFIKMNNAIDSHDQIQERIAAGYVIRTRSDIPVQEAVSGDTTRLNAALSGGAQYISTDYPEPSPFEAAYIARFPDTDSAGRCNPVNAPDGCQNRFITE
jgi:hypothetical protein